MKIRETLIHDPDANDPKIRIDKLSFDYKIKEGKHLNVSMQITDREKHKDLFAGNIVYPALLQLKFYMQDNNMDSDKSEFLKINEDIEQRNYEVPENVLNSQEEFVEWYTLPKFIEK